MLYDPKWDVKVEPLSLTALIAWLEQQPAREKYCYGDLGRCLAAQYNHSLGRKYVMPGPFKMLFYRSFDVRLEIIALDSPHTFGAALERARKIAARG